MNNTISTKVCSKCGEEKSLEEFGNDPRGKFGKQASCKKCEYNRMTQRRKTPEYKEYQQKYQKEYQKLDKRKEYARKYNNNYTKFLYAKDDKFRISTLIRISMIGNFRRYSNNGKLMSSSKYGIDFKAIFEKIGPKPEGNFHLDHIIPISKFDLDNPLHVRLAHHPENLRWLDATKNIQKSDSIDFSLISSNPILVDIAKQIGILE